MGSNTAPQTSTSLRASKRLIKQAELQDLATKCQHLAELKKELEAIIDEVVREGLALEALLRSGTRTETGPLTAGINETPGRRNIKWKEALAAAAGSGYVDQLQRNTPAGPSSVSLVIMDGAKIVTKTPALRGDEAT